MKRYLPLACMLWIASFIYGPMSASAQNTSGLPVPNGCRIILTAQAEGVQIYVSREKADGTGFEWKLKAPDARLYDSGRHLVARHFAGPTWEQPDGTKVVGSTPPQDHMNSTSPNSIPWLLIAAKSHDGAGLLSHVDYVMRVNTDGGAAPSVAPTKAGSEVKVKYKATYIFLTGAG